MKFTIARVTTKLPVKNFSNVRFDFQHRKLYYYDFTYSIFLNKT